LAAIAPLLAAKVVGARCVLHVQDLEIDAAFGVGHLRGGFLQSIARHFELFVTRRFDLVITISDRMKEALVTKGIGRETIFVLRNWVDQTKIRPLTGANRFREALKLSDEDFVVLYSGQIGPKQGLDILLQAAEKLVNKRGLVFIVAGEGPSKAALEQAYKGLPNVKFLPLQPEKDLCELLNMADLHVLTQRRRAADLVLPSKLAGMLATGRPVIVTSEKGTEMHEILKGSAVSTVIPPEDSEALTAAIQNAHGLGRRLPQIDRHVLDLFSAESILPAMKDFLMAENATPKS
jgi:colanic acid biosynthesis glycosyl transferase WcaI